MCFYIVCAVSSIRDPKLIVDTPIEMSQRSITGWTVSHAEQASMQRALKSQFLRTGKLNMISSKKQGKTVLDERLRISKWDLQHGSRAFRVDYRSTRYSRETAHHMYLDIDR